MRDSHVRIWRRDIFLGSAAILATVVSSAGVSALIAAQAQTPSPQVTGLSYEVASIKANKTGDGRVMLGLQPGGRFTAVNIPARLLIRQAYQLQDYQIVGAPDWTRSEYYDITAKAPMPSPTPDQTREMQQALLAERFQFQAHRETRELSVYALRLARADGRLGPGLKPSSRDCDAMRGRGRGSPGPGGPGGPAAGRGPGDVAVVGRGGPPAPPNPNEPMQFGIRMMPGRLSAGCMPLSQIAGVLTQPAGRLVQDKTGLTGDYDLELSFTPEFAGGRDGGPGPGAVDTPVGAPSLFTAIQEQTGLKLESQRSPVEVLVIDRMERPTED